MRFRFRSSALASLVLLALTASGARGVPTRAFPHPAGVTFDVGTHMDVNNLDMVVTNFGSLAYDLGTGNAGLIYPKGTLKTSVFAAGIWIGAKVGGATTVALGEYSQEFTPGPMLGGTFQADQAAFHNFTFSPTSPLGGSDLHDYIAQGGPTDSTGGAQVLGDETIWSVFNDADPGRHTNLAGSTAPLGVEVQQTVYAVHQPGPLDNAIFVRWQLLNKGGHQLDSTYVSFWSDPDLGGATDDLVGCDTTLALGYCYNATNADALYGSTPPAVGITLLRGPIVTQAGQPAMLGMTSFQKYINGTDPSSPSETYSYLRGQNKDGSPLHVLDDPLQPVTTYAVSGLSPGSTSSATNWLDSNPADRRMAITTGPFSMAPGDIQVLDFLICVGQGGDRLSSIADLRSKVTVIRSYFTPTAVQSARVTLDPQPIQLGAGDPWLTATIEPDGFDVASIVPSSVLLDGSVRADPDFAEVGDHDGDGRLDLRVRFARAAVDPLLVPGTVRVALSGSLASGDRFEGAGTVLVIGGPRRPLTLSTGRNPFQPSGTLRFTTTRPGAVRLRIFDAKGRLVRSLLEGGSYGAGPHDVVFDGRNAASRPLPSGIYWARIDAAEGAATTRLVLLR
ncbi:MAG: FlgD immunoglobulin-like domain containing protein [Bacteroidota bacterium]